MHRPPRPMKVLLLTDRFPPQKGGVANAAFRHALGLSPHLERLDVMHLTADLPPGCCASSPMGGTGALVHSLGRAEREDESLQLLEAASRALVRRIRHDVVHGFYAVPTGGVATLVGRLEGIPSVVSARGNDVERGIYQGTRAGLLTWTLQRATRVLCVSTDLVRKVEALAGRSDAVFTPNSVDPDLYFPEPPSADLRRSLGVGPGFVLGFFGELRFKKGMTVLLDAMERLAGQATLLVVGGVRKDERPRWERWRTWVPSAAERVIEVPYEREPARLRALYNLCDLVIFPSLWEGMPNALLEAMACGRPALAADSGGISDLLRDGRSGWLLSLDELDELAPRTLDILALSGAARAERGEAARARVVEHHAPEAEIQRLLAVYREVVSGGA